jgi:peptidoglycan hydrolase-like protein with peptidoglycan-binding domain
MPVRAGQSVRSGQVIAEVSGRPVIVLSGRFPAYRDIGDGDEGPDVRQLQQALRARYGTPVTGRADHRTLADLRRLYRAIGYPVPTVDRDEAGEEPSSGASSPPVGATKALRVPAGELFFVPDLPAVVGSTRGRVGGDGSGPLVTLTGGAWQLRVRLGPTTERLVESMPKGGQFHLDDAEGPVVRLLEIRAVSTGGQPDGSGAPSNAPATPAPALEAAEGGEREAVFVLPGKPDGAAHGQQREIFVERGRSSADAVVVPASALWTEADGSVSVEIAEVDGSTTSIEVEVVLSVSGRVAVRARTGELPVGARVVVAERDGEAPR